MCMQSPKNLVEMQISIQQKFGERDSVLLTSIWNEADVACVSSTL